MESPPHLLERTPAGSTAVQARLTRLLSNGFAVAGMLLAVLIVSDWATLSHLADRWWNEPQYSHGFLVPVFAATVLWSRREMLKRLVWQPTWLGLPLLLAGVVMRLYAVQADSEPLETFSLLPTVCGIVLFVGGWPVLSWSWPALAFLTFMMPLPYFLEVGLALPLRRLATLASTYALQTLGCPALAEGNMIRIEDVPLRVEEACSGLGMLMTFFALATAVAMVIAAPLWMRLTLIVSAIPIAIIANVLRITGTGIAYYHAGKDSALAHLIYHDLAGWLMMPVALVLLWGELRYLSHLLVEEPEEAPLPLLHTPQDR